MLDNNSSPTFKLKANKALGQHFLRDQRAIHKIAMSVPNGARVIEIGPGLGAITHALLQRVGALTVIEKDDRFASMWREYEAETDLLSVVHGDVLKVLSNTVQQIQPEWITGNLPYNISGPLTAQLASHDLSGGMVLMYQREVGNRIMAAPGSKTYGGLSVLARHHYHVKRLLLLPPGAFVPPPKVHSVVLLFIPHGNTPPCRFEALRKTVRKGFAHRRKTILNNFKGSLTADDFMAINIDPRNRAEQLDYDAWARITAVYQPLGRCGVGV
ncbi:MAG: 16S rRNA (adenine(1518)-N(6)/adenine(1519)-N(6))-dimethyltransferase RsmA [Mariprofundaceae bacterium]|nr:16S rRNA (adenine(1518)-N(6)/adenine(1519)-N(6))-dimethyltransferase RsmA [Mariprofundaceae bacterium]